MLRSISWMLPSSTPAKIKQIVGVIETNADEDKATEHTSEIPMKIDIGSHRRRLGWEEHSTSSLLG